MSEGEQPNIFKGPRLDSYETPSWIFDPLMKQYRFTIDLAASEANAKVKNFYSEENSFLENGERWTGVAWCNWPFSLSKEFAQQIVLRAKNDKAKCVIIYKSTNMESPVWRHIFSACSWIAQPHKRVEYLLDGKRVLAIKGKNIGKPSGAQFASAVIGFNVSSPVVPWEHTLLRVER